MYSKYFLQVSSEQRKIIKYRENNLIAENVLNYILNQTYSPIQNPNKFKQVFEFSTEIYENITRKSGEKYTQHPLRILKKAFDLNFKNLQFCSILYAHDILELIRENPDKFSKKTEMKFRKILSYDITDLEILTPQMNLDKPLQMEEILKTSSKSLVPISIPVITKIFDVHDNSYDQAKFKPKGVPGKLQQVELALSYLENNTYIHHIQSPFGIFNPVLGFPNNLTAILIEILLDSKKKLKIENKKLEYKII